MTPLILAENSEKTSLFKEVDGRELWLPQRKRIRLRQKDWLLYESWSCRFLYALFHEQHAVSSLLFVRSNAGRSRFETVSLRLACISQIQVANVRSNVASRAFKTAPPYVLPEAHMNYSDFSYHRGFLGLSGSRLDTGASQSSGNAGIYSLLSSISVDACLRWYWQRPLECVLPNDWDSLLC